MWQLLRQKYYVTNITSKTCQKLLHVKHNRKLRGVTRQIVSLWYLLMVVCKEKSAMNKTKQKHLQVGFEERKKCREQKGTN